MIRTMNRPVAAALAILLSVAALFASVPPAALASSHVHTSTYEYDCLYVRLRWGDTLGRLSLRYGVSVASIRRANGLPSTRIYAGTTLCIPRYYYVPPRTVYVYVPVPQYTNYCPYAWGCAPAYQAPPVQQSYGWTAEYFQGTDTINGPFIVKAPLNASTLDVTWGLGSPYAGVPVDNWSARFTQSVYLPAGNYNFWASADDGVIVWLDADQVIYNWSGSPSAIASGSTHTAVAAGQHLITVAYRHASGNAYIHFGWGAQ